MNNESVRQQLSLSSTAARNLATATVTVPQNAARTPRWLHKLLPWVDVDGGVYRVNRRKTTVKKSGFVSAVIDGDSARLVPQSLRGIPLFSGLDDASIHLISSLFTSEVHALGETIFNEGDTATKLIVVAKGKVELTVVGPQGEKLRQALLSDGSFYGDNALVSDSVRVPKGNALTRTVLLVLERSKLDELKSRHGELSEKINKTLEKRAHNAKTANEHGETGIDLHTWHGGEPILPTTFVDYEEDPREYHLSTIQTVLQTHTRVTDLYSNKIDQLREQVRLTIEAVKEWEEWELLNNPDFGLLKEVHPSQRITTRTGPPTPDDLDELLSLVWKKPAFFLAHPKAIAAFGRECTRRGVPPPTVNIYGSPFVTWRGVPLVPTDKLLVNGKSNVGESAGSTTILLLRVGESEQGVVGLQKAGVTGEVEPGLSVRYMGTNEHSIASHLVTRYFSTAVLTHDAIARLDNVVVGRYHDYP